MKPNEKRSLARPKRIWTDKVEKSLAEVRIQDGKTTAQDRQVSIVVMSLNGFCKVQEENR